MIPSLPIRPDISQERIHVLFVIDQLCESGGAERMLLNTIRLLPKERFRCSLVTFKIDTRIGLFQNLPCSHIVYPLRRTYDRTAVKTCFALRNFLEREEVRIVHTFHETSDLWAGLISKIGGKRILVSSRRDMGFLRSVKHDIGYRFMNPAFDLVLTVSNKVRQFCIERDRLSPSKVKTLYNGIELAKAINRNGAGHLRSQMGLGPETRLIVTVGNIRAVKGIDVLVETAAIVGRHHPEAVFLVMGRNSEPQYYRQLEERMVQLGIQDKVRFLGESENVLSVLPHCDIFFLPSRSEGFSNALIEAMACGLPCVATRVGGNTEAVEEDCSGYLIESEDHKAAADRIQRLLNNPVSAREMGSAGRKIVENRFTAEVMIQQLVGHYEGLLAARRS